MPDKTDIWMPIYIGDYLSDTTRLTTEQHGAYLLLLMDYWKNGPLPDDPVVLQQITKLSSNAWSSHQATILRFFTKGDDGLLHQKRSDHEIKEAKAKKEKAVNKARNAANARFHPPNGSSGNASSTPQAMPDDMLNSCSLPSPSPKYQDPPKGAHEGESDSPDLFPDGLHVNQYASGILERNGVPNGFQMIDATARAITAVATIIKKPLHVAAQGLETRLIVAIERGETVNRYWMDDSKWRSEGAANGQNHSSPAKQRVGAGVRAFAAAGAAARAARAVGDRSAADGPALPAPGPQRVGGDVSGRLRSAGGDVQPAMGHRSTARTAN